MISVLLLDGFSDDTVFFDGKTPKYICDIYLPLLEGILRFNGIACERVLMSGFENEYSIRGKTNKNLIYLPIFTSSDKMSSGISFIYTDSTAPDSVSFRIASKLRRDSECVKQDEVVFVNSLHENDPLKRFSPIIVDNVRVAADGSNTDSLINTIYKRALCTAKSICEYYLPEFKKP